jgi:hypothetical protein
MTVVGVELVDPVGSEPIVEQPTSIKPKTDNDNIFKQGIDMPRFL